MRRPVVETRDLRKTYHGKVEVPVLHGINMRIDAGEFVSIIGQSGSGKSTLLNLLGCLDRPTGGLLRIDGRNVAELDDNGLAELRSDRIGFVFQFHYLLDEFTCLENALMPISIRQGAPTPEQREWVISLLRRVGLGAQLHKTPDTMSGGQNQRCALVRALANRPRLLLADEPTGNLDSATGAHIVDLMFDLVGRRGATLVLITHDAELARRCDRVVRMQDGRVRVEAEAAAGSGR